MLLKLVILYLVHEVYAGIQSIRLNNMDKKALDQLYEWMEQSKTVDELFEKMNRKQRHLIWIPPTFFFRETRKSYERRRK